MNKKNDRKLALATTTVRVLDQSKLAELRGGLLTKEWDSGTCRQTTSDQC